MLLGGGIRKADHHLNYNKSPTTNANATTDNDRNTFSDRSIARGLEITTLVTLNTPD